MGERKWKRREFERGGENKVEKERILNWWGKKEKEKGEEEWKGSRKKS